MKNIKQATLEVIQHLPDNSTVEDIMYEVNLVAQVLEGLADEEAGNVVSTKQMLERIQLWKLK
jgi:predicted transcriptional regulator